METLMRSSKPAVDALLLLLLFVIGLAGCGKNITAANNVTAITITATATTVPLGGQTDFNATVTLANSTITTNTTVTWQVNGVSGGNAQIGTITPSTTDVDVGIYTAPAVAPSTNVNVTAIITQSTSSTSTATTTITSNTISLTIGAGTGLTLTPTGATVPAGGTHQFTAEVNNVVDSSGVSWSVSSTDGGNIGSIDTTGVYTAPNVPPPGGEVTITATYTPPGGTTETATATATIVYSDESLEGPFAFSYSGDNSSGLISVAGHFVADGAGGISSGIEDVNSFGNRVATSVPIIGSGSSYTVGADGRGTAVIVTSQGTQTWQFVLTSTQHALLTRFDTSNTGSGTIDQQSLDALNNVVSAVSGAYVFRLAGGDPQFDPMGVAGRFTANGSGGIPQAASIVDVNDNSNVTTKDTTLNGSYSFAAIDVGTGRGTLTLTSTSLGATPLQFAFYVAGWDPTQSIITQMHVVEIDQVDYLAGDVYSGPAGSSFTSASLASGNYVFTAGGNSTSGSYAVGGVFTSGGNGSISGGALDTNNAGTATADATVNQCAYSVDATTGRIDLILFTGSGTCAAGSGSPEFAVYQTAQNSAVMLELDSTAVASGTAYVQSAVSGLSGNFALAFVGQGVFSNAPASYQSDATGHLVLEGTGVSSGDLDISTFGAVYPGDPVTTSSITTTTTTVSTIQAPATNGRGTATIIASDPPVTYTLVYYMVSANMAVLIGQDKTRVETGTAILQY
jgi:hypothetical protein